MGIYRTYAVGYVDIADPTESHGLQVDTNIEAIVLNERRPDGELTVINLGDVVPRIYFSSEGPPESALPHQVREWVERFKKASSATFLAMNEIQRIAISGRMRDSDHCVDDPDICRLARAAAEVRELAGLLVKVPGLAGLNLTPLITLTSRPILILDAKFLFSTMPLVDAIADRAISPIEAGSGIPIRSGDVISLVRDGVEILRLTTPAGLREGAHLSFLRIGSRDVPLAELDVLSIERDGETGVHIVTLGEGSRSFL